MADRTQKHQQPRVNEMADPEHSPVLGQNQSNNPKEKWSPQVSCLLPPKPSAWPPHLFYPSFLEKPRYAHNMALSIRPVPIFPECTPHHSAQSSHLSLDSLWLPTGSIPHGPWPTYFLSTLYKPRQVWREGTSAEVGPPHDRAIATSVGIFLVAE